MSNDEFQALHSPQAGLKSLAGLDQIDLGGIVGCLGCDGGIVGGSVEEGRAVEVGKDYGGQHS